MTEQETRTILLLDGSASTLLYLSMLLKRLRYDVMTAGNAEDALRMMEESLPSIILTDLALPRMSGREFLRCVKETDRYRDIPVVTLSVDNDQETRDACKTMGSAAFLPKPVNLEALYRTLQSVLETMPRAHIRLATSLAVIVGDNTMTGGTRRIETVTALSEGGLFVKTRYPQPRNARTPLVLTIGGRQIRVTAEVLYYREPGKGPPDEPGMGMKFVDLSDADRDLIRTFIQEQLTEDIDIPSGSG